jgi:DNA-directed RNA polymerase specialized sigma24 family protein
MSPHGSVSRWLGPLQDGDPAAVQQLWQRYFHRLVGLARKKLHGAPRRLADEEDVALSAFAWAAETPGGPEEEPTLEQVLSREPDPEFAALVAEQCQNLLRLLGDKELETVALWRMEGYTIEEIGEKLGCAPRSVRRKLQLIRSLWEKETGCG